MACISFGVSPSVFAFVISDLQPSVGWHFSREFESHSSSSLGVRAIRPSLFVSAVETWAHLDSFLMVPARGEGNRFEGSGHALVINSRTPWANQTLGCPFVAAKHKFQQSFSSLGITPKKLVILAPIVASSSPLYPFEICSNSLVAEDAAPRAQYHA